ncbi:EIIAB-Man [Raoultella ornithinolytica]|nr:EIIAB-Man [Raoultella ornithinolytica]
MINVIVATHGPLANALLASGRMVYGELPHVFAVTLGEQAGIEGFREDFARTLASAGQNADGVLVLCDMQSGTPWNIACQHAFSSQTIPPVAVVAGVNFSDAAAKRRGSPFNGCARCCRTAAGVNRTDTGHGCPDDIRSVR